MKTRPYTFLFMVVFALIACKKDEEVLTKPVDFTQSNYQTLGTYDDFGKPNYLTTKDVVSSELLTYISNAIPQNLDLRTTNPDLLKSNVSDITITQPSDVFMTYVSSITTSTDAVAFYTYPTSKPPTSSKDIKTITYVFPNTGQGTTLQAGDKVKMGRFDVGTSIGFVLLHNGWNPTTKTLDSTAVHFCSNDVLNPEIDVALKKHAVLINYTPENKTLIAFENWDRTSEECNHDFNDVVLYTTVIP